MNRRLVFGLLATAAVLFVLLNSNLRRRLLPDGLLTREPQVDSSLIVTPVPVEGRPQVLLTTSKGNFIIETRPDLAPKTVSNYLGKWSRGECNDLTFHRVEDWVVQGCDPAGDGTGGKSTLPTETSSESFVEGSVGVARKATPKDVSNDSQFFVVKKDSQFLNSEYTYFGKVVSGLDVINRLAKGDKVLSTTVLTK